MDKLVPSAGKTGSIGRRPRGEQGFLQRLFRSFITWFRSHSHPKRTLDESFVVGLIERVGRMQEKVLFLTSVLDSTSDAVVVADLKGTIIMYNRGAEGIFELDTDVALGDNIWRLLDDFLSDNERPDGMRIKEMLIRDRRILNQRTQFKGFKGKTTPALLTVNFVQDIQRKRIGIVAIIKDNSEVESLTQLDALTGLSNHGYFERRLKDEYERMKRDYNSELSLLFLDVDDFRRFNNTFGHQVGDEVLRLVSQILSTSCRVIDIAGRYGGEEFCLLLPNTDEKDAMIVAERVRKRVEGLRITVPNGSEEKITISIGVRTHRKGDGGCEKLVKEADEMLYVAKEQGKNRTVQYERHYDPVLAVTQPDPNT